MYAALLSSHIAGAIISLAVVTSAIFAIAKSKNQQSLLAHAKGIGALTAVQYGTGAALMITSPENLVRGCVSLAVYTAVIVGVSAALAVKVSQKNLAQEKTRS